MFNVSALLLDDALLKCVVSEVVLFSILAFKTLIFQKVVWRHTWRVVESLVAYYYKCSTDSDSEISLNISQYLTKLRRTKQSVPDFLGHSVCGLVDESIVW